ncbi:MAG: ATP-grasp domain-containing protein [Deltaproteobacteria bacterium]|nr:ATP-grasp domain-containing protein [Deltaproteobacteria bacterium]MBW2497532.1 ATP-grasp domain-containing protein [Deltaproteobacteria bacterium]
MADDLKREGEGIRRIERLAIVNRGEAAMRCLRTAKTLREREGSGLEVIALYTPPDRDAPFVRQADRAVALPAADGAVAAYLDHDGVLAALRSVGADAVWPGWGFVAEDPVFVDRLAAEDIVFLGPPADAMRSLGDKITSKRLAEKSDVPVTDWSGGALADENEALQHAERIGYPVVLKATAGGGGRGIRIVESAEEMAEAFRSAESEARSAFGNGDLFVEAMVQGGRHIEVQVAADVHGGAFAFGSRDCSVQRRHQKVLEEAPPPGVSDELIARLQSAAVRLVKHVGYHGVGTVEFLLTGEDFFFLEVNPRLQVEHGITEEIAGVDLVEIQIRIARGESIADVPIHRRGVALEARVCAEDPDEGFLPSPGRIALFEPALGPNTRVDSGVTTDTVVSSDFDSLIAKVIAVGEDRAEAIARLSCGLRDLELVVAGGATNKGYLLDILASDDFRAGGVDTRWLDRWGAERESIAASHPLLSRDALVAAAILAYQRTRATLRTGFFSGQGGLERLPSTEGQQIDLSFQGESYRLTVYAIGSWRYRVHLEGVAVGATMREEGAHAARLIIDDRVRRILYDSNDLGLRLEVDGHPLRFGLQTAGQVRAGTPAVVVSISVDVGDTIAVGQPLGLLEAMKMEIGFQAPVAGTIKEIVVHKGQQVAAGDVLLVIEESAEDGTGGDERTRLSLPEQVDPLALLFRSGEDRVLGEPDLEAADGADLASRRIAIDAARDEIRRVLLGYDANPDRAESLASFLEAKLPEDISESFSRELAEIRHEVTSFADVEQLFIRAPSASVSGQSGPSNSARLRMYVRRVEAEGAGIDENFLELVKSALSQYGVQGLEPTDALRRALLRMLSCQADKKLRLDLMLGVLRRITVLAQGGIYMGDDPQLARSLNLIARMRPQVTDAVADAALEAAYVIFQQPGIEERARRSSSSVDEWLSAAEMDLVAPPGDVLLEVASSPRLVFERVGRWIGGEESNRRAIALAAHVQRRYAPCTPEAYRAVRVDGEPIHCVEYRGRGVVLAATGAPGDTLPWMDRLFRGADSLLEHDPNTPVVALEYLIPPGIEVDWDSILNALERSYGDRDFGWRMTVGRLSADGEDDVYKTLVRREDGLQLASEHLDLHPETAARIALDRYQAFELERLQSEEGIYAFYGRSRNTPGDERVFVLADARDRSPEPGRELAHHLGSFERVFNRAARRLRTILQTHDPRRRLQWNRIAIFVAPPIFVEPEVANDIARRLAPATRHLGLEKVLVRLNLLERDEPDAPPKAHELVISDTGEQLELVWRAPHDGVLEPAQEYERKVVAARRRRLIYPYEIVKMLLSEPVEEGRVEGSFEEYDLDPDSPQAKAVSVAGRPYGQNRSAVVFGLIRTPTEKVPEGMLRVLVLSDPTMGMGALSGPECDRLVAAFDLAESLRVPLEWVPVSSGAKIAMDSGTENLDATARVVRRIVNFTQAGGVVHVIVQGVNVGAQSYFDALATMLMHTRGVLIMTQNASMVLTGRAALEASGGVSAEDEIAIGGFERIMGPNGEAQYYARNLADAYRILYEHYRYSYVVPGESGPRRFASADPDARSIGETAIGAEDAEGLATVGEIFDDETNPGRKRPFAMRAVMKALVDSDGGHLERWNAWVGAETAIVWDAHIGGQPVSLIGIESRNVARDSYRPPDGPESWNGGTLFPQSSKKVARAVNAASGNRPVVVLANLSGFDGSPESLRKIQLETGAEIARAVVNFRGPIYFVVVSRYHGGAYVVFSQELNDEMRAVALTGSYASVIGGGPAAAVVFSREVRALALDDPRVKDMREIVRRSPTEENRAALDGVLREVTLEKQAAMAAEFDAVHTVERAREVGSLSEILDPAELRPRLIASLEGSLRGA